MRFPLAFAITSSLIASLSVTAQTPAGFDAAKLAPRRDSFVVVAPGRPIGFMREVLESTADGFRLISDTEIIGSMAQKTDLSFSREGEMRMVSQRGMARGKEMRIDVIYAEGRAKGSAKTPQQAGMQTIAVDAIVPKGAIDDNALQLFLPTLDLKKDAEYEVTLFASGKGTTLLMKAKVVGKESITVSAGTFDAWDVEVSRGPMPVHMYVSTTAPHRVVRVALSGSPVEFLLVK